jgi:thiamine monophosphate synthase
MGAHGVAVIREVMSAGDPQQAVRALLAALGETRAL